MFYRFRSLEKAKEDPMKKPYVTISKANTFERGFMFVKFSFLLTMSTHFSIAKLMLCRLE